MNILELQNPLAFVGILTLVVLLGLALPTQTDILGDKTPDELHLFGTWKGESICQVKNSPCHDEKAIYRISKSKEAGHVTIDLGKFVDGKAESMGVLDFKYDKAKQTLICEDQHRVWKFTVKGNTMEGTLTTPDKIIYRRVSLKKDK